MDGLVCIDISSGTRTDIRESELQWESTTLTAAWLSAAVRAGTGMKVQLPFSHLKGACGVAGAEGDMLVVVISKSSASESTGVLTLGVALNDGDGAHLWPLLCKGAPCGPAAATLDQPRAPWCAFAPWHSFGNGEDLKWAVDLAKTISWIWLTQRGLLTIVDEEAAADRNEGSTQEPTWRVVMRGQQEVWKAMRGKQSK